MSMIKDVFWRVGVYRCCGKSLNKALFCPICGKKRPTMTDLDQLRSCFMIRRGKFIRIADAYRCKARIKRIKAKSIPNSPELVCRSSGCGNPHEDILRSADVDDSQVGAALRKAKEYEEWASILDIYIKKEKGIKK